MPVTFSLVNQRHRSKQKLENQPRGGIIARYIPDYAIFSKVSAAACHSFTIVNWSKLNFALTSTRK